MSRSTAFGKQPSHPNWLQSCFGVLLIQATENLTAGNPEATARIVEGLITGMGFIGGGAILVVKASVRGTATAASLWATGAIGTAVGLGAYDIALVLSIMTFLTLRLNANLKPDGPDKPD